MSDLLPCPFCGALLQIDAKINRREHPLVPDCPLSGHGYAACRKDLDAAWNRRTPASTVLPDRAPARDTHPSPNAREATLRAAIYEVDKALENGSPPETWSSDECVRDEAREEAIEAITALLSTSSGE